ncbi:VTT domain-containing protein [Erythrobacter sp.]|uniref:VTT domain-containing protein n=1 Tax=Erythrobacter sp. TaxID=1042 RepID=UPI001B2B33F3|nr:VTT domain-containing protein [Erythrobacter sp.]MBO6527960.1 VTT domain-containing protein [Erythrobacter sp.]MBO6528647.1 VTT domain-containing protein [Erythrobacter sp.]
MQYPRAQNTLKYAGFSILYLSLFIIPFVLFGKQIETSWGAFFRSNSNDTIVAFVAGLLLAGDPVLPTPSSVIATLLATRIGFWPAALVNGLALSAACLIGYAIGWGGGGALSQRGISLPAEFVAWVQRYGLVAVLLCRPVPVLAEASLILAGAARHEPVKLLVWCCATQLILGLAYAFAGSGWGNDRWDSTAILAGSVGIPVTAAVIVLVSVLRRQGKKGKKHFKSSQEPHQGRAGNRQCKG